MKKPTREEVTTVSVILGLVLLIIQIGSCANRSDFNNLVAKCYTRQSDPKMCEAMLDELR